MKSKMTGPIPGENYTSDTKNYPWHRAPEFTDTDKAIDMIAKRLMSEEGSLGILTMLEMKVPVVSITDMFLTSGIGAGKWTPDFALLLAGPVAHIICLMADAYDIKYDLGIEDKRQKPTSVYFKALQKDVAKMETVKKNIDVTEVKEKARSMSGFMGSAQPSQPPAEAGPEQMGEMM